MYISINSTDGQAVGSNERRSKHSEEDKKKGKKKIGRFADLSMIYDYGDCPKQGLVVVEIKPPMKTLDGSRPDFVKIANEMKDSMDKMVKDGYDDDEITILGVLVEGFTCTLFIMDLVYKAIYRMIPLSVFYLPRSHHDYSVLPATFESMITLKKYMISNARRCFAFHRQATFKQTVRSTYIVDSFDTPESHNSKNNDD
ncbi:hypothetical protein BDC45DRAFT_70134 [Circinella umbellata]|nr:hypothetical protein BDC45DRAFT_70134 [Circinella umbellata]